MRLSQEDRERLEAAAKSAWERSDFTQAATLALKGYGPEVFGLVASLHKDPDDAADVFARATEALWKSLPRFAWECSLRTYLYTLAHNASHRARRDSARAQKRVRRASNSELDAIANRVRTETLTYLRTEKRTRVHALRESLPPDDQLLLVLRVDRGLAWNDLARVMSQGDLGDADLVREAARLRKRFQTVKAQLLQAARHEEARAKKA
jgi:RNA polymerase sigma-70 factor (ECF subfamily)